MVNRIQIVNFVPPPDNSSLASANFTSVGILNSILNLTIEMTGSLQNVAAAQANRLEFLTDWQKAYTDAMNQIHTFVANNGDYIGKGQTGHISTDWAETARNNLNQLNANYTQVMQNRQSVINDDAKALQSNVQQSNDAVSQQSNLGSSILQDFSTLLSAMFH